MGEDCVFVMNTYSFFYTATAPSMDRDWRGSTPRPDRYRGAINRQRPDLDRLFLSCGERDIQ